MIDIDEAPVQHLAMPSANSNLWGLPAPRSWVEEATPFAGVEIGGHGADSTRMTLESWLAARRVPAGTGVGSTRPAGRSSSGASPRSVGAQGRGRYRCRIEEETQLGVGGRCRGRQTTPKL